MNVKDTNLNCEKEHTLLENNIHTQDRSIYRVDNFYVAIIEITQLGSENLHELIAKFRAFSSDVLVQGVDANFVFGIGHLLRVLRLTVESWKRGIKISKIMETDILMRLCCTTQIAKAIKVGGLKNNSPACFILMSKNLDSVLKIKKCIEGYYNGVYTSVLKIGKNKMARLCGEYGIPNKKMNRLFFENYLIEKAALVKFHSK